MASRIVNPRTRGGEAGIVGLNLVLVIAFALYAVIMLSRTTLAAKQIDDRVRVIVTEVGPGSNVSRLDETQKLNTIGQTAEDILVAAKNLSGQAQTIIDTAKSIDNTVSAILANANEINSTVRSINATASSLLPTVQTIHGDGSDDNITGGVDLINRQAGPANIIAGEISLADGRTFQKVPALNASQVPGIRVDLNGVLGEVGVGGTGGHGGDTIHRHTNSINCAVGNPSVSLLGVLDLLLAVLGPAPPGCDIF
jgi:hypothetical protein